MSKVPKQDPTSDNARHRAKVKPPDLDDVRAEFESIEHETETPGVYLPSEKEIKACMSSIRANRMRLKMAERQETVHDQRLAPNAAGMSEDQFAKVRLHARVALQLRMRKERSRLR